MAPFFFPDRDWGQSGLGTFQVGFFVSTPILLIVILFFGYKMIQKARKE
jgi:hypothetical protein